MFFDAVASGALGADKQYLAFPGSQFAQKIGRIFIQYGAILGFQKRVW